MTEEEWEDLVLPVAVELQESSVRQGLATKRWEALSAQERASFKTLARDVIALVRTALTRTRGKG